MTAVVAVRMSNKPMMMTKDVFFMAAMTWLVIAGRQIRKAWGRMMRRVVCQYVMFNDAAASYCPRGMACRPPRMTSA